MKKLLYTVAKTKDNKIVKANNAEKNEAYYCVVCGGEMVLKKSEKQLRRSHFAHKVLTENCTPEGALHFAFKNLLFERIDNCLKNDHSLEVEWLCEFCNQKHKVNLLKKTENVKIETTLDYCKPDIVLFDENNTPIIAIEVVVTHYPEETSLKYFRDNKIVLIRFDISVEEDLESVNKEILSPSQVLCCLNYPKCDYCGSFMRANKILISNAECWKCDSPMKIARPDRNKDNVPDKEQLDFLQKMGVKIELRHIRDWGDDYVSVCKKCNLFCGPVREGGYFSGQYELEEYGMGYRCPICSKAIKLPPEKFFFIK
jgi:hypothetical protein